MKQAKIYNHNLFTGVLAEDENGYTFQYDADYLQSNETEAIRLTMPLTKKTTTKISCFRSLMD